MRMQSAKSESDENIKDENMVSLRGEWELFPEKNKE